MKSYYSKQNNKRIIVYTVILALILGIGAVVVQDIEIPTEQVSQDIEVKLEK